MEHGEYSRPGKKRNTRCLAISVCAALLVVIVIAVALGLSLSHRNEEFKATFIARCEGFHGESKG